MILISLHCSFSASLLCSSLLISAQAAQKPTALIRRSRPAGWQVLFIFLKTSNFLEKKENLWNEYSSKTSFLGLCWIPHSHHHFPFYKARHGGIQCQRLAIYVSPVFFILAELFAWRASHLFKDLFESHRRGRRFVVLIADLEGVVKLQTHTNTAYSIIK